MIIDPFFVKIITADYRNVWYKFGTLADIEELIAEMHDRGMKLVLDYVPNHTSIQNKFFQVD